MRSADLSRGGHVAGEPRPQALVRRQVRVKGADHHQVIERGLPEVQRPQAAGPITVTQPLAQPEWPDPRRIPGL
jgi:hypothetical protein